MITIALTLFALAAADIEGKVVSITDGDTIVVRPENGLSVKVRLDGIDAPERRQPFSAAAQDRLGEMVFGKVVTLKTKGTDRYGRTLATVMVGETNANLELVKAGLAWHYKQYSKDAELARAEAEARRAKRGLWVDPAPVAPWDHRAGRRKKAA